MYRSGLEPPWKGHAQKGHIICLSSLTLNLKTKCRTMRKKYVEFGSFHSAVVQLTPRRQENKRRKTSITSFVKNFATLKTKLGPVQNKNGRNFCIKLVMSLLLTPSKTQFKKSAKYFGISNCLLSPLLLTNMRLFDNCTASCLCKPPPPHSSLICAQQ